MWDLQLLEVEGRNAENHRVYYARAGIELFRWFVTNGTGVASPNGGAALPAGCSMRCAHYGRGLIAASGGDSHGPYDALTGVHEHLVEVIDAAPGATGTDPVPSWAAIVIAEGGTVTLLT